MIKKHKVTFLVISILVVGTLVFWSFYQIFLKQKSYGESVQYYSLLCQTRQYWLVVAESMTEDRGEYGRIGLQNWFGTNLASYNQTAKNNCNFLYSKLAFHDHDNPEESKMVRTYRAEVGSFSIGFKLDGRMWRLVLYKPGVL